MTIANCLLSEPDAKLLIFPIAAAQLARFYSLAVCVRAKPGTSRVGR